MEVSAGRLVPREPSASKGKHFASDITFAYLHLKNGPRHQVVVKRHPELEIIRVMLNAIDQFHNEVTMYSRVLPLLGVEDLFPKMWEGRSQGSAEEDIIVLEDVSSRGFKISEEAATAWPDVRHLEAAVEALGRLHAASYSAKVHRPTELAQAVATLRSIKQSEDSLAGLAATARRGLLPHLAAEPKLVPVAVEALSKPLNFSDWVIQPEEPMAVVCHGDYCCNNMLFRYEGERPVEVMLLDLGTSRYSSPAIDLSFLLYLNCSPEVRAVHWDRLIDLYLSSVAKHLPPDVPPPSRQVFLEDFSKRAIYGYSLCCFFLPMMRFPESQDLSKFSETTPEEQAEFLASIGGKEGEKLVSDIVQHLIDKRYLHSFVRAWQSSS